MAEDITAAVALLQNFIDSQQTRNLRHRFTEEHTAALRAVLTDHATQRDRITALEAQLADAERKVSEAHSRIASADKSKEAVHKLLDYAGLARTVFDADDEVQTLTLSERIEKLVDRDEAQEVKLREVQAKLTDAESRAAAWDAAQALIYNNETARLHKSPRAINAVRQVRLTAEERIARARAPLPSGPGGE